MFADRGFYADWWNSTSWDQFARDWNRPVHNFLLRHVYHSSISAFQISRSSATAITFLLSACVHELVMWCIFKKLRGYLMGAQLLQLPLMEVSRRYMKGQDLLGNIIFWVGLFTGWVWVNNHFCHDIYSPTILDRRLLTGSVHPTPLCSPSFLCSLYLIIWLAKAMSNKTPWKEKKVTKRKGDLYWGISLFFIFPHPFPPPDYKGESPNIVMIRENESVCMSWPEPLPPASSSSASSIVIRGWWAAV